MKYMINDMKNACPAFRMLRTTYSPVLLVASCFFMDVQTGMIMAAGISAALAAIAEP